MNRFLAYLFVGTMVVTVIGQGVKLLTYNQEPISDVILHESRLLPFLYEIQDSEPQVYEDTLLNLSRIRPAERGPDRYQFEEIVVAETLIQRLDEAPAKRRDD